MASSPYTVGGHDFEFVEPPPDDLLCLICTFVARDPQQLTCCGRIYCRTCLERNKMAGNNSCPYCRHNYWQSFPDKKSSRNISALRVKCHNRMEYSDWTGEQGCDWIGELGSLEEHLQSCNFELIPCKNECENMEGGKMAILRKNELKHLFLECPYRTVSCGLCAKEGRYSDITGSHLQSCPGVEIECPNSGCKESVKRKDLSTHKKTCEYELVACRYADVGCDVKMARKDAGDHEDDVKLHLSIVVTHARKLQTDTRNLQTDTRNLQTDTRNLQTDTRNLQTDTRKLQTDRLPQAHAQIQAKLEAMAECMESNFESLYSNIKRHSQFSVSGYTQSPLLTLSGYTQPQPLTWSGYTPPHSPTAAKKRQAQVTFKLPDYHSYMKQKGIFYSPPFYTSPGGYKMCVKISATTDHLTTYIYLMHGESDNNLTWPFRPAEIKIELLNQIEDNNHIEETISYPADRDSESNRRVTEGQIATTGYGRKFITLENVKSPYLDNDTLYFRVTVLRAPTPKPWLACTV